MHARRLSLRTGFTHFLLAVSSAIDPDGERNRFAAYDREEDDAARRVLDSPPITDRVLGPTEPVLRGTVVPTKPASESPHVCDRRRVEAEVASVTNPLSVGCPSHGVAAGIPCPDAAAARGALSMVRELDKQLDELSSLTNIHERDAAPVPSEASHATAPPSDAEAPPADPVVGQKRGKRGADQPAQIEILECDPERKNQDPWRCKHLVTGGERWLATGELQAYWPEEKQ